MKNISQEQMRSARSTGQYTKIWTSRGKCVFCDLKDKYILFEENGIYLTLNLYPYIDGHLLAIPRDHISSPKELTSKQWDTIRKFGYISKKLIRKTYDHKAMWTLIREGGAKAQMSVADHLHVQFIPFDKEDLCKWNYRELQYTPIESKHNYSQQRKNFAKYSSKFQREYAHKQILPIIVDAIIHADNEILFQSRKTEYNIKNIQLTLPGGHADDTNLDLITNLKSEILAETGIEFGKQTKFSIIDSEISTLDFLKLNKFLKYQNHETERFIWNTYLVELKAKPKTKVGDEIAENIWIKISEIEKNQNISAAVKQRLKSAGIL